MEASLLLTLLPPLPPAFNSPPSLAFFCSFSCLLLCAKITSSHAVDLVVDRSARIKKCFFLVRWTRFIQTCLVSTLSQPRPRGLKRSPRLAGVCIHIQPGQEQNLSWPVIIFTQRKKFESCTLENISIRNTLCHNSILEL